MALRGKKPEQNTSDNDKSIEINAQMQGSLVFKDPVNLKINGEFTGDLSTRGTLTIGSSAKVDANISGDNVILAGKVRGDIHANVMLVLMPTAILNGNVTTPKLNIVEGAIFQGFSKMTEGLLNIDEVAKYLEIDMKEIEELANSGKIPATKSGGNWKFERNQIDNWVSSVKVS